MAHSEDAMFKLEIDDKGVWLTDADGNRVPFQVNCKIESDKDNSHAIATVKLLVNTK